MTARLEPGDCRDVLLEMAARGETFDAVVTDPPYELTSTVKRFGKPGSAAAAPGVYGRSSRGFMGKTWDGTGVAFEPEMWAAVAETLKPGAHLLAFGGTRTFHRMVVAIEDAGFELRDTLMWMYGTGFPKSHDVSKGIDKAAGAVRKVIGPGAAACNNRDALGLCQGHNNAGRSTSGATFYSAETAPATPDAERWQGWGTALKPAWEPIIVARKPLIGTVVDNVLTHGTGALNIDASRIPLAAGDPLQDGITGRDGTALNDGIEGGFKAVDRAAGLGRWPANVLHDGSDEVEAEFARYGEGKSAHNTRPPEAYKPNYANNVFGAGAGGGYHPGFGDSGTAARFFYSAKASAADRAGSKHPTVKPLALMRWLLRLVTPPGGTVLDPFAGSGTTLHAALECGFSAVGIEREAEYQADIRSRLEQIERMYR